MATVSEIFTNVYKEQRKNLLEPEAKTICQAYDIPVTRFEVAQTEEEALKYAEEIGFPIVLKVVSPQVIHKSDVGGVALNLQTQKDVGEAYRTILTNVKEHQSEAQIAGILVQEMAPPATEVIVGSIKDAQFGQSIMFGLGGIFVEVLKDVVFRIAPVTKAEAELMITEIKAYPVLTGYRNHPPLDTQAIADIIVKTSTLVMEHQIIKELDLNPIMVYEKGAKTVDARIILE
jgi:acyl-CoA synthetase (NDP forming)